jgi:hypothetical protein
MHFFCEIPKEVWQSAEFQKKLIEAEKRESRWRDPAQTPLTSELKEAIEHYAATLKSLQKPSSANATKPANEAQPLNKNNSGPMVSSSLPQLTKK